MSFTHRSCLAGRRCVGRRRRRRGAPTRRERETPTADILPYVVPMFAYVALGGLESYLPQVDSQPSPTWYPIAYAVRVVIVAAMAWYYRSTWKDLRPFPSRREHRPGRRLRAARDRPVGRARRAVSHPPLPGQARLVRPDADVPRGANRLLRGPADRAGAARPPDRGAVLAVVPDPMADRPGLPAGADRAGDARSRRP